MKKDLIGMAKMIVGVVVFFVAALFLMARIELDGPGFVGATLAKVAISYDKETARGSK